MNIKFIIIVLAYYAKYLRTNFALELFSLKFDYQIFEELSQLISNICKEDFISKNEKCKITKIAYENITEWTRAIFKAKGTKDIDKILQIIFYQLIKQYNIICPNCASKNSIQQVKTYIEKASIELVPAESGQFIFLPGDERNISAGTETYHICSNCGKKYNTYKEYATEEKSYEEFLEAFKQLYDFFKHTRICSDIEERFCDISETSIYEWNLALEEKMRSIYGIEKINIH